MSKQAKKTQDDGIKAMVAAMVETAIAIEKIAAKHGLCSSCLAYKTADMMSDGALSEQEFKNAHGGQETVQ